MRFLLLLFITTVCTNCSVHQHFDLCECVRHLDPGNFGCVGPIQFPIQNSAMAPENFQLEFAKQLRCQLQRRKICCGIPEAELDQCFFEKQVAVPANNKTNNEPKLKDGEYVVDTAQTDRAWAKVSISSLRRICNSTDTGTDNTSEHYIVVD